MRNTNSSELQLVDRWRTFLERVAEFRSTKGRCFDSVRLAHGFFLDEMKRIERDVASQGNPRLKELNTEASYAMAALADETARVCLDEEDRRYWFSRELEQEFFHTVQAGTEFYARVDALLKRLQADEQEVRILYFRALALGFRGEYSGEDAYKALDKAKALLRSVDPDVGHFRITPDSYDHVHKGKDPRLGAQWALLALITIVVLVICTVLIFVFNRQSNFSTINRELTELAAPKQHN